MADPEPKNPKPTDPVPDPKPTEPAVDPRVKDLEKELERVKKNLQKKLDDEEKAKLAALEEQGKFKEVAEALKKEVDPLKEQLKKYQEIDEKRREALLGKLPEAKREIYSTVALDVLEDLVETLNKKPTPGSRPGSTEGNENKKFDELNSDEQMELRRTNPALYTEKYREMYKRKNNTEPLFIP